MQDAIFDINFSPNMQNYNQVFKKMRTLFCISENVCEIFCGQKKRRQKQVGKKNSKQFSNPYNFIVNNLWTYCLENFDNNDFELFPSSLVFRCSWSSNKKSFRFLNYQV